MNDTLKLSRVLFLMVAMMASIYAFATNDHSYKYRSPEPMPAHMLRTNLIR